MGMLHYPALLWAQLIQSLFIKGEFDEENDTSTTSQLADLEKEASILDLEAGLNFNVSPSSSSSSSSSLSSPIKYSNNRRSSLPAAAKQKGPIVLPAVYTRQQPSPSSSSLSSSSHPPSSVLVSLPCNIINTNQNPNPDIPALPAYHHQERGGRGGGGGLNPIAQIFRDQEFGRMIMGFPMPLAGVFATPYAPTSSMVRNLVFMSLSLGVAALWNGILFRNVLPIRYVNFIEQIGAAFVLLAVFGLFSSFLPVYLLWIPWACFLAVLFPICLSLRWG